MARSAERRKASEVARLLREYEATGLTERPFAEAKRIPPGTLAFRLWQARQGAKTRRGRRASVRKASGGLVRVLEAERGAERPAKDFEVVLRNNRRVRVPVGFDEEALRRLLEGVDGSC